MSIHVAAVSFLPRGARFACVFADAARAENKWMRSNLMVDSLSEHLGITMSSFVYILGYREKYSEMG